MVLDWLERGIPTPSTEHNIAIAKHEGTIGSWLVCSKRFRHWMDARRSLMWIVGDAGFEKKGDMLDLNLLCSTTAKVHTKGCHCLLVFQIRRCNEAKRNHDSHLISSANFGTAITNL